MHIRAFVIATICICISTTSAVLSARAAGDTGGVKGVNAHHSDCMICKSGEWQIASGKRNPNDQGREN